MRDTLKKYSPKRENVNLGWLNKHLHDPLLWKWNKRTIAKAFAIGLFCAFLPLPIHTLLAAIFAVIVDAISPPTHNAKVAVAKFSIK